MLNPVPMDLPGVHLGSQRQQDRHQPQDIAATRWVSVRVQEEREAGISENVNRGQNEVVRKAYGIGWSVHINSPSPRRMARLRASGNRPYSI
jgi:hypothetical protein